MPNRSKAKPGTRRPAKLLVAEALGAKPLGAKPLAPTRAEPLVAEPLAPEPLVAKPLAPEPLRGDPLAEPEAVRHARRCFYLIKTPRGWTHWDCQSAEQWYATDAEIEELVGAGRLARDGADRVVPAPPSLPKAGRF